MTTALFLLSLFYGAPAAAQTVNDVNLALAIPARIVADRPMTLETYVRTYFRDEPILAEIARCESSFRQIGANGKVFRGQVTPSDVGVMQVNEFYHRERAEKLGFDLHTLDGNLAYARWLYDKKGTAPWASSEKCWQKSERLADAELQGTAN